MRTCSTCGSNVIPGDNFCANCGARYDTAPAQISTDAASDTATAAVFDSQPVAAAAINYDEAAAEAVTARPEPATQRSQAGQTANGGQPRPAPAVSYGHYGSPQQPPGQFSAPPGGAATGQHAPVPVAAVDVSTVAASVGFGVPQTAAVCPKCHQVWTTGSQSCTFCGQVWGLPDGIVLSPAGRRLGGVLLDGLLIVCTLVIGWVIWTLVVWAQGQTPGKQLLGMRVVRLDTRTYAGWGKMFLRDFVGKLLVAMVSSLIPFIGGVIADCWLLWDKDRQELWDKIAGTIVVNDPDKQLAPSAAGA
jgi:uncharacterized RDD family membrane protein YckC/RNA polymerase subunit RPABC4/transcription elongation factor Spt4